MSKYRIYKNFTDIINVEKNGEKFQLVEVPFALHVGTTRLEGVLRPVTLGENLEYIIIYDNNYYFLHERNNYAYEVNNIGFAIDNGKDLIIKYD